MSDKKKTKSQDKNPSKSIKDKKEDPQDKKTLKDRKSELEDRADVVDFERTMTVDKKIDRVYARKEIDMTRKADFKKRIAEMKQRTQDSPKRTVKMPDKNNPLTNLDKKPPPRKTDKNDPQYPDKNLRQDKKKTPQVDLTRKRKSEDTLLDKRDSLQQPDKKFSTISGISCDKNAGQEKKRERKRARNIEKGIQDKITKHFSSFSKFSTSRNSRDALEVPGPQPEGFPGGGGQLETPLHHVW